MTDPALLIDVLTGAADQRRRAATRAAAEIEAERASGKDVRAGALRVVRALAEAATLDQLATDLSAGRRVLMDLTDAGVENIADDILPPAPTVTELRTKLTAVPNPPEEPPMPAPPPDEAAIDAAAAEAEAILDAAFPTPTILGESDPVPTAVIPDAPLPPGHGDDDDPDPSVDVAALPAFDAEADLEAGPPW